MSANRFIKVEHRVEMKNIISSSPICFINKLTKYKTKKKKINYYFIDRRSAQFICGLNSRRSTYQFVALAMLILITLLHNLPTLLFAQVYWLIQIYVGKSFFFWSWKFYDYLLFLWCQFICIFIYTFHVCFSRKNFLCGDNEFILISWMISQ